MNDLILRSPDGPHNHLIAVWSEEGRTLLTLDQRDGRLVAEYDPADLDEAAAVFLRHLTGLYGEVKTVPLDR